MVIFAPYLIMAIPSMSLRSGCKCLCTHLELVLVEKKNSKSPIVIIDYLKTTLNVMIVMCISMNTKIANDYFANSE